MTRLFASVFILALGFLPAAQAQWQPLNGPPGANVRDMERGADGTLYVVSNLDLFTSVNNGDNWQEVDYASPSILDLEGITFDPAGTLYGVNYSRLYRSTDKGLNWELLTEDGDFYGMYDVRIFGPNNDIVVHGWNGAYVSTDDGETWQKIWNREIFDLKTNAAGDIFATTHHESAIEGRIIRYPFPGTGDWDPANWQTIYTTTATSGYDMRLIVDGSSNIYAAVYNDIILSQNNGGNWSSMKGNITQNIFAQCVWAISPGGTVYLTNGSLTPPKIYTTTNKGASWTVANSPTENYGSYPTRITFGSGSTVFLGSDGDGVFRSDNNGSTWAFKSAGLNSGNGKYITVSEDGRIIYLNNYRQKGYWSSTDNGATWSFVVLPDYTQKIHKLADGRLLFHSGGPMFRSDNDGASFSLIDNSYVNALVEDASGNLFGADYNIILKSVSGGDNWTSVSAGVTGLPAEYYSEFIAIDNTNATLFVWLYDFSISKNKLYKIPIAGGAATLIDSEPWATDNSYFVRNVFYSDNKLYVAENRAIYESDDEGETWTAIRFSGTRVFPIDGGICVSRDGAFYVTQDGGKSWNSSSVPGRFSTIWNVVPIANGFLAAATNSPALKFTGDLVVPVDQLPPYIDFDWQPTDGPYGGYISKVFTDNAQNTYALSDGRLFKTLTFSSWQKLPQGNSGYLQDAIIDKPNNTLYTVAYNALLKSTTGGTSWASINSENIPCRQQIVKCSNGNIVMYANCTEGAIYVSTDGGVTFGSPKTTLGEFGADRLVASSVSNAIFVHAVDYSTGDRKLMRSLDNGNTWEDIETPMPDFQIGADNSGNIFLFWSTSVYKSADDGETWVDIKGDLPVGYIEYSVQPFTTPAGAFLLPGYSSSVARTGYWKTTNGGTNWTFIPSDLVTTSLTSVGNRIVAGTSNGVYTSDDEAQTFAERSHGINLSDISDLEMINPSEMVTLVFGNQSHSTDDFDTWERRSDLAANKFFRNPDGSLIAFSGKQLFKTEDNGETWISAGSTPDFISDLASADGELFFITTTSDKIQYSEDLQNWTDVNATGLPGNFSFISLAVNPSGFIFVVIRNHESNVTEAYQILYGGAIRLNLPLLPQNVYYSFTDDKILLYDGNGDIYETTDGSDWSAKSAPSGDRLFVTAKEYYFISQYDGTLWLSRNKGQTWQSVGLSFNAQLRDITVNEFDGHAYAALYDHVVHKSGSIIIPPEAVPPVISALHPANGTTDAAANTKLTITFDEVVTAVPGKKIRIVDVDTPITPVETIDATAGIQTGKTFTFSPLNELVYEKTYFVIVDAGAFQDIFGNAFAGLTANTLWRFTVQTEPDIEKPTISYTLSNPVFVKGASNKLQITVTDDAGGSGVDPATVKIKYRGITSDSDPATATMTNVSGNTYEVTVEEGWMDEMGLEYLFEAKDNGGNVQVSPASGSYHRGYIAFPEAGHPSLPSAVVGSGGLKENYRMFSIPHKLSNANITSIFEELSGMKVNDDYRILHFVTESHRYVEYPSMSTIIRGMGYWINIKSAPTIAVQDASTPENSKEQLFSLTLQKGWNQIGNPYPFPISWNAVRDASGNANIGTLKTFNGNGFVDDDKLSAFEAGFVLLNSDASATIDIPFSARTSTGRIGEHNRDFEEGWIIPLAVEGSKFRTLGGVGMHPEAEVSFDRRDDAMPPKVFDLPEIHFAHDEHFLKHFTRDIVPPHESFVWSFSVNTAEEKTRLKWDMYAVRGLGADLYMLDEANQTVINMSEKDQCEVVARKSATYKIYYGYRKEDIKPSRILLGKPYPNPFTDKSSVAFTLPENTTGSYTVSLDVYDMMGKKVANLAGGQFPAGFYTREWVPERGRTFEASLYLYRLTVSGENATVILTQKITIKK